MQIIPVVMGPTSGGNDNKKSPLKQPRMDDLFVKTSGPVVPTGLNSHVSSYPQLRMDRWMVAGPATVEPVVAPALAATAAAAASGGATVHAPPRGAMPGSIRSTHNRTFRRLAVAGADSASHALSATGAQQSGTGTGTGVGAGAGIPVAATATPTAPVPVVGTTPASSIPLRTAGVLPSVSVMSAAAADVLNPSRLSNPNPIPPSAAARPTSLSSASSLSSSAFASSSSSSSSAAAAAAAVAPSAYYPTMAPAAAAARPNKRPHESGEPPLRPSLVDVKSGTTAPSAAAVTSAAVVAPPAPATSSGSTARFDHPRKKSRRGASRGSARGKSSRSHSRGFGSSSATGTGLKTGRELLSERSKYSNDVSGNSKRKAQRRRPNGGRKPKRDRYDGGFWLKDDKTHTRTYVSAAGEKFTGAAAKEQARLDEERHHKRLSGQAIDDSEKLKATLAEFNAVCACVKRDDPNRTRGGGGVAGKYAAFDKFRSLGLWGIPGPVVLAYRQKHVIELFDWQMEALSQMAEPVLPPASLGDEKKATTATATATAPVIAAAPSASASVLVDGRSLIYSAPTSGGKSLVAEVLMLRRLLEWRARGDNRKVLCVFPYVALVSEKLNDLKLKFSAVGFTVGAFHGTTSGDFEGSDILVSTIERANGMVNRLIEERTLDTKIGCLVVDEIHFIGTDERGALIEMMLIKLLTAQQDAIAANRAFSLQIIGMSATLPNVNELAAWLGAALFETNFRPVPLHEHVMCSDRSRASMSVREVKKDSKSGKFHLTVGPPIDQLKVGATTDDRRLFGRLVDQVVSQTPPKRALVFCGSKRKCELLAETIAKWLLRFDGARAELTRRDLPVATTKVPATFTATMTATGVAAPPAQRGAAAMKDEGDAGADEAAAAAAAEMYDDEPDSVKPEPVQQLGFQRASQHHHLTPSPDAFQSQDRERFDAARKRVKLEKANKLKREEQAEYEKNQKLQRHKLAAPTAAVAAAGISTPTSASASKNAFDPLMDEHAYERLYALIRSTAAVPQSVSNEALALSRLKLKLSLQSLPDGCCQTLQRTITAGVAYHHSGLTSEERDLIEGAFRSGTLCCLVATSTLGAGVNLPAQRVVFDGGTVAGSLMETHKYRQMSGRAGRQGLDEYGEVFMIESSTRIGLVEGMMKAPLPEVRSQLEDLDCKSTVAPASGLPTAGLKPPKQRRAGFGLERLILDVVAGCGFEGTSKQWVENLLRNSLFYSQAIRAKTEQNARQRIAAAWTGVCDNLHLIEAIPETESGKTGLFRTTKLGAGTFAANLSPREGVTLHRELMKAVEGLCLEPTHDGTCEQPPLMVLYHLSPLNQETRDLITEGASGIGGVWDSMADADRRIATERIGVKETFMARFRHAKPDIDDLALSSDDALIAKRFIISLILRELLSEVPLSQIEEKFHVKRGALQQLLQMSAIFAGQVGTFCERLQWHSLELLAKHYSERLTISGGPLELRSLMSIPDVKRFRARALFAAGIRTVADAAGADPNAIADALEKAAPFRAATDLPKETPVLYREQTVSTAKRIRASAKELLRATAAASLAPASANPAASTNRRFTPA